MVGDTIIIMTFSLSLLLISFYRIQIDKLLKISFLIANVSLFQCFYESMLLKSMKKKIENEIERHLPYIDIIAFHCM